MRIPFTAILLAIFALVTPAKAENVYLVSGGIVKQNIVYAGFKQKEAIVHGYHFAAGYTISPHLAGELGYTMLDDYKEIGLNGQQNLRLKADMLELAALLRLPIGNTTPYLRLAHATTDTSVSSAFETDYSAKTDGIIWGAGVDFVINPTSALRLDFTRGKLDGGGAKLDRIMLGLKASF